MIIENENKFYDYTYGIWLQNNMDYKKLYVNDNDFYMYDNTIPSSGNWKYYGTAISALNYIPTKLSDAEISDNEIGKTLPSTVLTQPRIGIRVSNMERVRLLTNSINFDHSTAPSEVFSGILLQNCRQARLNGNEIENLNSGFPVGSKSSLVGLRVNESNNTCIENSEINGLGYSMEFTGICIVNSLFNNTFANYDTAIFLNMADIGAVQGRASPQYVLSNNWSRTNTDPTTATLSRVEGIIKNAGQIKWYYQVTTNNEFYPTSQNIGIIPNSLSSPTSISLCPPLFRFALEDVPPFSALERNAIFGHIVGDSARYEDGYEQALSYHGKIATYKSLKLDTTLLIQDDPADDSFVAFYQDLNQSNMKLFNEVAQFASYDSTDLALELVSSIEDTNIQESALKETYAIYFNGKMNQTPYSSTDTLFLEEQANENAILNGIAALMTRNILFLEVHETTIGSNARMVNPSNSRKNKVSEIVLFPNPTNSTINIHLNDQPFRGKIEVYDLYKIIDNFYSINGVYNIPFLESGSYFLKLFDGERNVYLTRFNVVK